MLFHHMKLGTQPHKLTQDTILLQNDKCIIKATAGTLTLPILIDNNPCGHLFIGKGELTLDTIVETTRGAIGKPLVKNLTQPYAMFSKTTNLNKELEPPTNQDLTNMGYKSTDEFLKTANDTFDQFTSGRRGDFDVEKDAHIFAFATEHSKWDILIAKAEKLVYTSKEKVYISKNNGHSVSLEPGSIFVSRKGKTVIIDKGNILVERHGQ